MTIEECLYTCESLIAEQKALGGKPIWSPRLVEAVKTLLKGTSSKKRLEVHFILNGDEIVKKRK